FHISAVIQTRELGTIMPTKKEELTIVLTEKQRKRSVSGGEFHVGVRISYLYSGGIRGEYGIIYYYNHASNSFMIEEEWTDLNKRHPIPESSGSEVDKHAGLMNSSKEHPSPLNRVRTEEIIFLDDNGERVLNPQVKQRVRIGLTIRNNQDKIQPFAFLVQIQNQEGVTERLNSITGVILPWQSLQPLIPWIPERVGDHKLEIFVWESIENSRALAPKTTITITALEKKG
ncbi:MAG: hypothetical protein KGL95_02650, partial [Patescibacteria group bacterium]|nr:hypothetical protein [Patescibacteria group bacterium]